MIEEADCGRPGCAGPGPGPGPGWMLFARGGADELVRVGFCEAGADTMAGARLVLGWAGVPDRMPALVAGGRGARLIAEEEDNEEMLLRAVDGH